MDESYILEGQHESIVEHSEPEGLDESIAEHSETEQLEREQSTVDENRPTYRSCSVTINHCTHQMSKDMYGPNTPHASWVVRIFYVMGVARK